jgi:hypothetical protein
MSLAVGTNQEDVWGEIRLKVKSATLRYALCGHVSVYNEITDTQNSGKQKALVSISILTDDKFYSIPVKDLM